MDRIRGFLIGFYSVIGLFIFVHIINLFMIWGFWRNDAPNYQLKISSFAYYDFGYPFTFLTWWSPTNRQFELKNFAIDISLVLFASVAVGLMTRNSVSKPNYEGIALNKTAEQAGAKKDGNPRVSKGAS